MKKESKFLIVIAFIRIINQTIIKIIKATNNHFFNADIPQSISNIFLKQIQVSTCQTTTLCI